MLKILKTKPPLQVAIESQSSTEIAGLLLNCGADVDAKDKLGNVVLPIQVLLKHHANVNIKNIQNSTPLHLAVSITNNIGCVRISF